MSLIFMMIVLENQLKISWKVLEFEKKFLSGHHVVASKSCENGNSISISFHLTSN